MSIASSHAGAAEADAQHARSGTLFAGAADDRRAARQPLRGAGLGQRADFGGELVSDAEGLAHGRHARADNMAANLDTVPVLFEAAADAAVSPATGRSGRPSTSIPNQQIRSGFDQTRRAGAGGQDNRFTGRTTVDKAAVAVTEEVPFKIDIVEPKVPLVHGGSMNLKVVAERKRASTTRSRFAALQPAGRRLGQLDRHSRRARPKR